MHKGHISIMEKAMQEIGADELYIGLNASSPKGDLTSLLHRTEMLKLFITTNTKYKLIPFSFDFNAIDETYQKIFNMLESENKYYILIGEDQLSNLKNWYNYDYLVSKFNFIVARRDNSSVNYNYNNDNRFIFINHDNKNLSSRLVKQGNYHYTIESIKNYILENNLYLKEQISLYVSDKRWAHIISVAKTALLINEKAHLNLNPLAVEKAALLHDVARDMDIKIQEKLMKEHYSDDIQTHPNTYHQYIGEHIANKVFMVTNKDILNAIKYHTTGRANMSLLEKLVYVSDKIEPTRKYDTTQLIDSCCNDFESGFKKVLEHNKDYVKNILHENYEIKSLECFNYYLD